MKKIVAAIACITLPPNLYAESISIPNHNFNLQALGDKKQSGDIAAWSVSGGAGVYNPGENHIAGESGDGAHKNAGYLTSGGIIRQALAAVLEEGNTYTINFDVGNQFNKNLPDYAVRLMAGGVVLAEFINPIVPVAGEFGSIQVAYVSNASDPIGQTLQIDFKIDKRSHPYLIAYFLQGGMVAGETVENDGCFFGLGLTG